MKTRLKAALGTVGGLALAVGLVAAPNAAMATPTTGSFAFTSLDGTTTTDLKSTTSVTIIDTFGAQGNGSGNLSAIASSDPVTLSGDGVAPLGASATFTVYALGSGLHTLATPFIIAVDGFTFNLTSEMTISRTDTGSGPGELSTLGVAFVGTLTGPGIAPDSTASVLFGFTQTGGGTGNVSYSATGANPNAVTVPEPASMALLGTGLLGMGLIRRRKHG